MSRQLEFTLGQRLKMWLISHLGAGLLRLLLSTCRVEVVENAEVAQGLFAGRIRVVGATWHRAAIFFLYHFGPLKPAIMVSRSKDGELLARYLSIMGCQPVRGSSSKGGAEALSEMEHMLVSGRATNAATVADGPRGPAYQAKVGMVVLAMRSGLPLLPLIWSCDRAWIFKKAWDRTMIPKPFAKILVAYGLPRAIAPDMDKEGLETARLELELELNRLRELVDRRCGHSDPE
jgi:hypothetical protein